MSRRPIGETVETAIAVLVSDYSLEAQWEAVAKLTALLPEPRVRDVNCSLMLLSHLEKLTLGSLGHPPELARAVAKIIIKVTHSGWKSHSIDSPRKVSPFRSLCSPLMVKTADPTILMALCYLLFECRDSALFQDQITVHLAPDMTVLDRAIELFLHPSCSVRGAATALLRRTVELDVTNKFPSMVQPIIKRSRMALAVPQSLTRCYVCSLLGDIASKHPACVQDLIDAGVVNDMLRLVDSYKHQYILDLSATHWLDAREYIIDALDSVVANCTDSQIHQLVLAGIVPTLLEWIASGGLDQEIVSVQILNTIFRYGEDRQIEHGLRDNPYSGPYRGYFPDSFWDTTLPDDLHIGEFQDYLYKPENVMQPD
eukprot:Protomagalhaensia_sp_Gyna_25__1153@NODE_1567_length_1727_cov_17_626185_g1274_i0_p1_GENE_NODE_1567_length_1727_cov_17_626185_g1274_i0NODE_1567_length_1727_cov_17_626185_g1274_i0_p1_ORF_typecomplete_len370_score30_73Arm_2/PF04826_13/0_011Arm_2/PF04826_13/8_6e02STAS/PF01740_21/0_0056Proteasom_PSMB/PF10508_9/0_064Proteasom_PSMB/PF10508_9/5_5e02_NODE_1567_length_1727_cov_17_626185_g1274_i05861695